MSKENDHGGARKGAGRPTKADEIKMLENMDAVKAPDKVWEALAELVDEGNQQAIKTWLAYRYGKPTEKIDLHSNQSMLTGFKVVRADE